MIRSMELVNYKIHENLKIEFSPGLNVIVGPNGSGKTSIIEAIGYALFDWTPIAGRSVRPLIRRGERIGYVGVLFDSMDDESDEVIVTRYLNGPQWDLEVDGKLVGRKAKADTVLDQIKVHLGLYPWHNPTDIFESVVAPPQARIIEPYMLSQSPRRAHFEGVFGVDKFNQAYNALRPVISQLEGEILDAEKDAIRDRVALLSKQRELEVALQELERQIKTNNANIKLARSDNTCPMCGQPLSDSGEHVLSELKELDDLLSMRWRAAELALANTEESLRLIPEADSDAAPEKRGDIEAIQSIRSGLRLIPTLVSSSIVQSVSNTGHGILSAISGGKWGLRWDQDYGLFLIDSDGETPFGLMSTGQRVMAATAITLALSRYISPVPFLILDEPTTSIGHRNGYREMMVEMIKAERSRREQIIIVTHGDDFSGVDNVIDLS